MRDLAARIPPDTREQLEAAVEVLERYGPMVANALDFLREATTDAWFASQVPASLDPAEWAEPTDQEWSRLEAVTGINRGWTVAFALADTVNT